MIDSIIYCPDFSRKQLLLHCYHELITFNTIVLLRDKAKLDLITN